MHMTILRAAAAFLLFMSTFQSATAQSRVFDLGQPDSDPQREWTVMIYLDGDNDLETFSWIDMNEMELGLPDDARST